MFLNFEEYTSINEEKNVKSFKHIEINKAWKTYAEMKGNFISRGYKFLGTIFCERKTTNIFNPKCFESAFTDRIKEFEKDYKDIYLSISLVPEPNDSENYERFEEVLSECNVDEVTLCKTKSGKDFYVFFNRDKKYFYFLNTKYDSTKLNMWLRLRTSGEDVVYGELCTEREIKRVEYEKWLEQKRKEKEEEEKKSAIQKAIDDEYNKYVDILKNDIDEHPENYEDVEYWSNLPKEIQDAIKNGIKESDYVEYSVKDKSYINPYDYEAYIVWVNDRNMTKGYKYWTEVFVGKPGTYYGD